MFDPERAVLVERRNALGRGHEPGTAVGRRDPDELDDRSFRGPIVPRWQRVGLREHVRHEGERRDDDQCTSGMKPGNAIHGRAGRRAPAMPRQRASRYSNRLTDRASTTSRVSTTSAGKSPHIETTGPRLAHQESGRGTLQIVRIESGVTSLSGSALATTAYSQ